RDRPLGRRRLPRLLRSLRGVPRAGRPAARRARRVLQRDAVVRPSDHDRDAGRHDHPASRAPDRGTMSPPPAATLLALLAALPFAASLLLACFPTRALRLVAWAARLATLAACAVPAGAAGPVFDGEVLRWSVAWMPALGLELGFRMDG